MNPLHYFTYAKTTFIPLKSLYPECLLLIEDSPKLAPLTCLYDSCHKNDRCMETLAHRIHFLFEKVVPETQLILAYFTYHDRPNSIRAGEFYRTFEEPRVLTLNRSAFLRIQKKSEVFSWVPPSDFFLKASKPTTLIKPEDLLRRD